MISYRKVGGLHFIKVWRFGITLYLSNPKPRYAYTRNKEIPTHG